MALSRRLGLGSVLGILLTACSHSPIVKTQNYAALREQRTFEYALPAVWHGIEDSLKDAKVTRRDPSDPVEIANLTERTLETDWIYDQSRDKYQEYFVNESPRKKYLKARFRYEVVAESIVGG